MTIYSKYLELVRMLNASTLSKKLNWLENPNDTDEYTSKFSNGSVSISRAVNDLASDPSNTVFDFFIKIYDGSMNVTEEFNDFELSRELGNLSSSVYQEMRELFNNVRRSARGADSILDNILSELG